jgi:cell division protein FtsZ
MGKKAFNIVESDDMINNNATIKVIGVGGAGGNMLNHMIEQKLAGIELICANTDAQALRINKAPIKVQLGKELTKGLGAGMKPEIGRQAAEESYEELKRVLEGADLVFISAGMGGGTGTGAAPVIAKIAKEIGALTIGVVTKPFRREGARRIKIAEEGFNQLKEECDSIVTILNQKLLLIINRNAGKKESYRMVDNVLYQAVSGITNMIVSHGENDVNVDFEDLKTVMSYRGMALMGIGHKTGEHSAHEALKQAIESPLLDEANISDSRGLLIHFTTSEKYPLVEIDEAMIEILSDLIDNEEVFIIEGQTTDNSYTDDEIKVTIIATGFEDKKIANKKQANNINVRKIDISNRNSDIVIEKVSGTNEVIEIEVGEDDIDKPAYKRYGKD